MECQLEFGVLGPLEVRAGARAVPIGGPRQRAILAILLASPGRIVSVHSIIEQVWNGQPPTTGRTQVAICVAALRKSFRAAGCRHDVIVTASPGYLIKPGGHRLDATEFHTRVATADRLARHKQGADAAEQLQDALRLWRGPAFTDISSEIAEAEAARLGEQRLLVIEQLIGLRLDLGEHRTLIGQLNALVQAYPLRDQLRAFLMTALYRSGRRADALTTFHDGRRISIEELGLEPVAALRELHDEFLREGTPGGARFITPPAAEPLPPPAQLPSNITAFTGRKAELEQLDRMLVGRVRGGPVAVSLITGSVGVGKSGLAVHWAHRVAAEFPDGKLFVDYEALDQPRPVDPADVLKRFLGGLGVPDQDIPCGTADRAALYRSMLDGRKLLVVINNASSYAQVRPLLPGSGLCCVVVTGRAKIAELVDGSGARVIRLGRFSARESVELLKRLLHDRRTPMNPDSWAHLGALCGHVPIALRAAASQLIVKPHWTVDDIIQRLADRSRRLDELSFHGRTVRTVLDLSYQALHPTSATAYRRLGALYASELDVTLAADALETTPARAEHLMESLVDFSLLDVTGRDKLGRLKYRFPDLVRLHAQQSQPLRVPAPASAR